MKRTLSVVFGSLLLAAAAIVPGYAGTASAPALQAQLKCPPNAVCAPLRTPPPCPRGAMCYPLPVLR